MNKLLICLSSIALIYGIGVLLGSFFDISMIFILPYIGWFIALILFYLILDEKHSNIFIKELNELNQMN